MSSDDIKFRYIYAVKLLQENPFFVDFFGNTVLKKVYKRVSSSIEEKVNAVISCNGKDFNLIIKMSSRKKVSSPFTNPSVTINNGLDSSKRITAITDIKADYLIDIILDTDDAYNNYLSPLKNVIIMDLKKFVHSKYTYEQIDPYNKYWYFNMSHIGKGVKLKGFRVENNVIYLQESSFNGNSFVRIPLSLNDYIPGLFYTDLFIIPSN